MYGLYNPKSRRTQLSVEKDASDNSVSKYRIIEVLPIEHQSKYSGRQVNYVRTRVDLVTYETLRRMYEGMNTKEEVKILETPNFYIIQYGKKPPILVNRRSGRLFEIQGLGYSKEEIEHQAATLLSIWNSRGLVEGMVRGRINLLNGGNLEKKEYFQTKKFISQSK